jgi:hypothetical protein
LGIFLKNPPEIVTVSAGKIVGKHTWRIGSPHGFSGSRVTGFGLHEFRTHAGHDSPETATGTVGFQLWPPIMGSRVSRVRWVSTHGFELTGRGSSWFRSWVPSEIAIKQSDFGFGSPESPLDRRSSALCTSRRVVGFGSRLSLDLSVSLSLSISLNLTPTVSQLSHSVKRRRNEE